MIILLLLSIPSVASAAIMGTRRRRTMEWIHASATVVALIVGASIGTRIWAGEPVVSWSLLGADALSAFMIGIVTFVGAVAGLYSVAYMRLEFDDNHLSQVRLFYALFQLFIFTMLLAVATDNLGLMWVAIEGTTLATVFLVNLHDNHTGLEAAYKYLIISSVGIALAFMGTVLMYYAASIEVGEIGLSWTMLISIAARLNPSIVKLAFIFILIGFGTKAGLAPMHTWLPDAHGQAPTPVSVLLSGALLNCALYGVLRFHLLAAGTLGLEFSSDLLLGIGALSILVAVPFVLVQHDLKRLLAYSSVEHMGIVALAVGIGGPLGLFAAAFHMFNHSLAKTTLFVAAGALGQRYGTLRLARMRGAFEVAPLPALGLVVGTIAITGAPPFAPFASEFGIAQAGFTGRPAALAGAVVLIAGSVLVFGGMLFHVLNVALRTAPRHLHVASFPFAAAFVCVPLVALLVMGIWLPPQLREAFSAVAAVLRVAP